MDKITSQKKYIKA